MPDTYNEIAPEFNASGQGYIYFCSDRTGPGGRIQTNTTFVAEWSDHWNVDIVSLDPYRKGDVTVLLCMCQKRSTAEKEYEHLRLIDP